MNPLGRSQRSPAQHFVRGSPLAYREKLEALWRENPYLNIVEAARRTGASRTVAQTVQRRMRERGELPQRGRAS